MKDKPAGRSNAPPSISPTHQVRRLTSRELFQQDSTIEIVHGEAIYRLQITRQGKLILTK